eukprot:UN0527
MVEAPGALQLPKYDYIQAQFGVIALSSSDVGGGGYNPNHQICCYSACPTCAEKFNVTYKGCLDTPLR